MGNLKSLLAVSVLVANFACAGVSFGAPQETAEDALKKAFPNLPYKSVKQAPIDGLYEVLVDSNIMYFAPKSGHMLFGEIFTKEGRNLTAEARDALSAERIAMLTDEDRKKAVKVGNGKHTVIEVTDPDCPFCRKLHQYWKTRPDVTRYVFFLPLPMHPDAELKAKYILASKDQAKALEEVFDGKHDGDKTALTKNSDDKGLMQAHKGVVAKLQVNSTPMFWLNGKFIKGANTKAIESVIGVCKQGEKGKDGSAGADSCGN